MSGSGGTGTSGDAATAGVAGLALSYALPVVYALQGLVGAVSDTEKELIAVERAREYVDVRPEDDRALPAITAALEGGLETPLLFTEPRWSPKSSSICFEDATVLYPGAARPAVAFVSLRIPAGTKLGICGATGSGKSTLLSMLWRLVPLSSGRVFVGGEDISPLPLADLRHALACVPQEPILVSGALRLSVDTHSEHDDAGVRAALDDVGLSYLALDTVVADGASNLSHGERQLVCLARALLRRTNIIGLDEASSATDAATDARMQGALERGARAGTTCVIVAHRVASLRNCDLVVVMEEGRIVEGPSPPATLIADAQSRFAAMLRAGN